MILFRLKESSKDLKHRFKYRTKTNPDPKRKDSRRLVRNITKRINDERMI